MTCVTPAGSIKVLLTGLRIAHQYLGDVHLAASADEAAEGADVVLLCTSAAAPVVDARRLAPGSRSGKGFRALAVEHCQAIHLGLDYTSISRFW